MSISEVGNINTYKHRPREVITHGTVWHPLCILKFYEMCKERSYFKPEFVNRAASFLEDEIKEERIDKHSGLGFAILSEDSLNVARWDKEYPTALRNDIYIFDNQDLNVINLLDIRDVGAFCVWELGIVNFEREQWMKYLQSERYVEDKHDYIKEMIEGPLQ